MDEWEVLRLAEIYGINTDEMFIVFGNLKNKEIIKIIKDRLYEIIAKGILSDGGVRAYNEYTDIQRYLQTDMAKYVQDITFEDICALAQKFRNTELSFFEAAILNELRDQNISSIKFNLYSQFLFMTDEALNDLSIGQLTQALDSISVSKGYIPHYEDPELEARRAQIDEVYKASLLDMSHDEWEDTIKFATYAQYIFTAPEIFRSGQAVYGSVRGYLQYRNADGGGSTGDVGNGNEGAGSKTYSPANPHPELPKDVQNSFRGGDIYRKSTYRGYSFLSCLWRQR